MDVLVVGGQATFVAGTFARKLGEYGVKIIGHWEWHTARCPARAPIGTQGIIVLKDMTSHAASNHARDVAKAMDVPYICIPRKFAEAYPLLRQVGIIGDPIQQKPTEVSMAKSDKAELTKWAVTKLETGWWKPNTDLAREILDAGVLSGVTTEEVHAEVSVQRAAMFNAWKNGDTRSMLSAMQNWVAANPVTQPILEFRAETERRFGVAPPDEILTLAGFQKWEISGAFTRARIKTGVEAIYARIRATPPAVLREMRGQLMPGRPAPTLKIITDFRGKPPELVTLLLLTVADTSAGLYRLYKDRFGVLVGPGYYDAVKWMMAQHDRGFTPEQVAALQDIPFKEAPITPPVPVIEAKPTEVPPPAIEVEVPVIAPPEVQPPITPPAIEAQPPPPSIPDDGISDEVILSTFRAAVQGQVDGTGSTDALLDLVQAVAFGILKRNQEEAEVKAAIAAAEAEVKAAEELYQAAQQKAAEARARAEALRVRV